MKGKTMLAKLEELGAVSSFSRPRVSDDNAFAEALFRQSPACASTLNTAPRSEPTDHALRGNHLDTHRKRLAVTTRAAS